MDLVLADAAVEESAAAAEKEEVEGPYSAEASQVDLVAKSAHPFAVAVTAESAAEGYPVSPVAVAAAVVTKASGAEQIAHLAESSFSPSAASD